MTFMGNIPGYFYDEEKKKYFKIQANHIAPVNAKYNITNAKLDRQSFKKRKREVKREETVRQQTVVPARSLRHPLLSGAGLQREHGNRSFASQRVQQDLAFAQGLEVSDSVYQVSGFEPHQSILTDAHYLRGRSKMLMAIRHGEASHAIYEYDCNGSWTDAHMLSHKRPLHAFHEPIIALHHITIQDSLFMVAATARANAFSGNLYVGHADRQDAGCACNAGGPADTLRDCKISPNYDVACAGTFGVRVFSILQRMDSVTDFSVMGKGQVFAVDWLDRSTLAMGMKQDEDTNSFHDVYLWDTRNNGMSGRIERDNKINGIHRPDDSSHNLVVASSSDISLYVLRNLSKRNAVLSVCHKSGTPYVHVSTLNGNLLAATDWQNKVQLYSLRTGDHLRTMRPANNRVGLVSKPRWQEDSRGVPYLQACVKNTIQRWS